MIAVKILVGLDGINRSVAVPSNGLINDEAVRNYINVHSIGLEFIFHVSRGVNQIIPNESWQGFHVPQAIFINQLLDRILSDHKDIDQVMRIGCGLPHNHHKV